MSLKCDGTNGILQSYDYQTPSTGFSYTFAAGTQMLFMVPASTLATGTITMPSAPADGMMITFSSSQQITALTLQGNTGQSISSAVTFLPAQSAVSYVYRLSNLTWYPCESVPGTGSQLVAATAQATTSGTTKDFTGIPSWVKRITVMFNGVSTNSTSNIIVQLGTGGGPTYTTSGYAGTNQSGNGGVTTTAMTTGFLLATQVAAAGNQNGSVTLTNLSGNVWTETGILGNPVSTAIYNFSAGAVTLGAALTAVRITTANGTDTFDAGSVNILYE